MRYLMLSLLVLFMPLTSVAFEPCGVEPYRIDLYNLKFITDMPSHIDKL